MPTHPMQPALLRWQHSSAAKGMPLVTIWQNGISREFSFEGTPTLSCILQQAGYSHDHPCGGRGSCGKCAVVAKGAISEPTEAEVRAGCRLSCQITLLGDTEIRLPDACIGEVELSGNLPVHGVAMEGRFGAAVDIGTTTIALKLYDLKNGRLLAQKGVLNPQSSIAADVMGRIGAAMEGQLDRQQDMVVSAVARLLKEACMDADIRREQVDTLVVTGNTTMLYLLTGRDPSCLSHAPFQADCLFGREDILMNIPVYYPACMNAFVGADITCAVLDSGMTMTQSTALLCDIGTNGELALWKDGVLYVASTAAGPAFEGAGISCGCGSIPGAIDKVWLEDGAVKVHTIGEGAASGLCGSGLLDAIAVFLRTEDIDETGYTEADSLPLAENVALLPEDIRAVQLAKGAIAAGIRTLMEQAQVTADEIETVYIAGGFGSHLDVASAAQIGLIPGELAEKVRVLGNAALSGAAKLLLDRREIAGTEQLAGRCVHVNLGGNSRFSQYFVEEMLFGEECGT